MCVSSPGIKFFQSCDSGSAADGDAVVVAVPPQRHSDSPEYNSHAAHQRLHIPHPHHCLQRPSQGRLWLHAPSFQHLDIRSIKNPSRAHLHQNRLVYCEIFVSDLWDWNWFVTDDAMSQCVCYFVCIFVAGERRAVIKKMYCWQGSLQGGSCPVEVASKNSGARWKDFFTSPELALVGAWLAIMFTCL